MIIQPSRLSPGFVSGDFLRQTCANQHATMSTENMSPVSKDKADKMSKKRRREEEELAQQKKLKKSKKDRETAVKQESTEEPAQEATPSKKEKKKRRKKMKKTLCISKNKPTSWIRD